MRGLLAAVAVACSLLLRSADGFAKERPYAAYVRQKELSSIRKVYDMLPHVQKFVIGGRFEIRDDPEYPFCRRNIGGRFLQAFIKKHRITLSNAPHYHGWPGYAHMNGSHVLVWLAHPEKGLGFQDQLRADMLLFRRKLEEAGRQFDPTKCLLVVDDWKLPIGKAVIRLRGGYEGSHFLQEIANVMDISEMPRLRVGIGVPAVRLMDEDMIRGWLMGEFDNLGKAVVPRMQPRVVHMIQKWIELPTTKDAIEYCRTLPDLRSAEGIAKSEDSRELLY